LSFGKYKFLTIFIAAYLFRLGFGLLSPPILTISDATQSYLIGLKSYTTNTWPYFGPDTEDPSEGSFKAQCPGALEGLMVAVPLWMWPDPLCPYLLVNLLSVTALAFLGWYVRKRLPNLSPWVIYPWLFLAPWDTHISTQVFNLSYAMVGSILFFVGFTETIPGLKKDVISGSWANAMMGFSLFWIMQFHMSWVLFLAFSFISFFFQLKSPPRGKGILFFFLGAIPSFVFVLPTFVVYGLRGTGELSGLLSRFDYGHFKSYFTILARFFSFACFEMPRFIGSHTPERKAFLLESPLLMVSGIFLMVTGWIQAVIMLVLLFKKDHSKPEWQRLKLLVLGTSLLIWVSFWFTIRNPDAHRFYLTFPVAMIYFFYCWDLTMSESRRRKLGFILILTAVVFQFFYALQSSIDGKSVFLTEREKIAKAIELKDYRILAERRSDSLY